MTVSSGPPWPPMRHVPVIGGHHQRVPARSRGPRRSRGWRRRPARRRARYSVGRAAPPVAGLVDGVQLDHDEGGLAAHLSQQVARPASAWPALAPLRRWRRARSPGPCHRRPGARARGAKSRRPPAPAASAVASALPPRDREGVLDAQRPRIVVRGLAVDLLPGAAEHHRAPGQGERGLADAAVVVGAARAQLVQERQAPRGLEAEAVHQHQHDLARDGARPVRRVHGRQRERRLVAG